MDRSCHAGLAHVIGWMDWPNMIKDERLHQNEHAVTSIMPTFYMDEADHNRFDKPRLDFVVWIDDGPSAKCIWLPASPDNQAIGLRRRYLEKVRRKFGRDWQRH